MPTWVKSLILLLVVGVIFYGGYKAGYNSSTVKANDRIANVTKELNDEKIQQVNEVLQREKDLQDALDKERELSLVLSKRLAILIQKNKQLKEASDKNVKTEIISNPIYTSCVIPNSGVSILNDTIKKFNQQRRVE